MKLKFKKLHNEANLPTRGTAWAGGLDLYCCGSYELNGSYTLIPTGVAVEIPEGYVGLLITRSSTALSGIDVSTTVIDADYRGQLFITARAKSVSGKVTHGQRIAQLVILPLPMFEPEWAEELSKTARGSGGYGSTGV